MGWGETSPRKKASSFFLRGTVSFKVVSLMCCFFPFTDKKRGETGDRERSSADVNYWGMLSGSPTEPVAMATHSGYGPL